LNRKLSIFVDESGDFGSFQTSSPYYLVAMLLHDQSYSINSDNAILDKNIQSIGHDPRSLHSGPIIRREGYYLHSRKDERRKLLRALLAYCQHVPIQYTVVRVNKWEHPGLINLTARLSRQISLFINSHIEMLQGYDEIVVYYDDGQIELTRILTSTLNALLSNVTFRRVNPSDYKLFQLVDMLCTLELTNIKFENSTATRSEQDFFQSAREFRRNYFKVIRKKWLE